MSELTRVNDDIKNINDDIKNIKGVLNNLMGTMVISKLMNNQEKNYLDKLLNGELLNGN